MPVDASKYPVDWLSFVIRDASTALVIVDDEEEYEGYPSDGGDRVGDTRDHLRDETRSGGEGSDDGDDGRNVHRRMRGRRKRANGVKSVHREKIERACSLHTTPPSTSAAAALSSASSSSPVTIIGINELLRRVAEVESRAGTRRNTNKIYTSNHHYTNTCTNSNNNISKGGDRKNGSDCYHQNSNNDKNDGSNSKETRNTDAFTRDNDTVTSVDIDVDADTNCTGSGNTKCTIGKGTPPSLPFVSPASLSHAIYTSGSTRSLRGAVYNTYHLTVTMLDDSDSSQS